MDISSREENASNKKLEVCFRLHQNQTSKPGGGKPWQINKKLPPAPICPKVSHLRDSRTTCCWGMSATKKCCWCVRARRFLQSTPIAATITVRLPKAW